MNTRPSRDANVVNSVQPSRGLENRSGEVNQGRTERGTQAQPQQRTERAERAQQQTQPQRAERTQSVPPERSSSGNESRESRGGG